MRTTTLRRPTTPPRRRPVVAGLRNRTPKPEPTPAKRDHHLLPLLGATALTVLLVAVGVWLLTNPRTGGNRAIIDPTATSEVSTQVRESMESLFSYRYDDFSPTEAAARDHLTGDAISQYATLFNEVRTRAPEQKLSVRSTVALSGVTMLDDDRASLLVFLDQTGTRADGTTGVAAQLVVSAQRVDGTWRISSIQPR